MKGRAGRKGKDTVGESYLVCRGNDIVAVKTLMAAEMPSVESCLAGEEGGLKRYVCQIFHPAFAVIPPSFYRR